MVTSPNNDRIPFSICVWCVNKDTDAANDERYAARMRRVILAALMLALITGCTSHPNSFVAKQLTRKATRQDGPKTALATGIGANGMPWLLDAYRIDDGRICVEHAWEFKNGRGSEATCTPDNHPRTTFQHWSTFPGDDDIPPDETPWLIGIILDDGNAVKLRATRGEQTQIFNLIRSDAYRGNAFYIGRTAIPELPEKVELLDATGAVIASAEYVQGV